MINTTVLQDGEIFTTVRPGGEPYVWKIVEGKPEEIDWWELESGDYRLKLEDKK